MIRQFLKEYLIWYLCYIILGLSFIVIFALYHLPLVYFQTSFFINFILLLFISIRQYQKFKNKLNILHHFIYVKELETLTLPSEIAYQKAIIKSKEISDSEILREKTENEQLRKMIKMWSHQMKIPIAALSLMSQVNQANANDIQEQVLQLQHYLDVLLTYLKFSQNRDDFRFETISVREVVAKIIKTYHMSCSLKNISIELVGDWRLNSDRKWLSFAISQVIDNAIKYSKENSQISIAISDSKIVISDNGIGILKEDLPRLFEEGFTGFNGHEYQKSTGLGLYMTKKVLDTLNLKISISSQVDKGTQVSITS